MRNLRAGNRSDHFAKLLKRRLQSIGDRWLAHVAGVGAVVHDKSFPGGVGFADAWNGHQYRSGRPSRSNNGFPADCVPSGGRYNIDEAGLDLINRKDTR